MKASFIDLGGNTARVDPQTTPTSYIRLQIFWQAVYDDRSGAEVNSPRAGEIYMTVEQADVLAEALKSARMPKAQAAPPAVAGPSDRIPIEDSIAWQETGTGVERNAVMVSGRTWYRDDHPLLAPTTKAEPQREVFDEDGFRAWVIRNMPDNTIIGNSTWWAGHLAVWVRRFMSAAPQAAPASQDALDAARYRWLAAHCRSTAEHWGGRWSIIIEGPAPKSHTSEDDFDAAIDAARTQQGHKP